MIKKGRKYMLRYTTLAQHYLMKDLLEGVSPTMKKFIMENLQETAPWALNAVIVPSNTTVGKILSSEDSSQAKEKIQSGSGTPQSTPSGMKLTITYKGTNDVDPNTKVCLVTEEEASKFYAQLDNNYAFPTITTENQEIVIPAKNIIEISLEKEKADVNKVSKSKGKKTTDVGS